MHAIRSWLVVVALLALIVLAPAFAGNSRAEEAKVTGSSEPVGIDPLNPHAGDFLDVDLTELAKRATSLYQSADYKGAAAAYLALISRDVRNGARRACEGGLRRDVLLVRRAAPSSA